MDQSRRAMHRPVFGLRQGRRRDVNRHATTSLSGAYSAFKADPDSMTRTTALSLIRKSEAGDAWSGQD